MSDGNKTVATAALTLAAAVVLSLATSAQALVIMPMGDSITVGAGSELNGGYRYYLQELLYAAGADYDFYGTQTDGPGFLGTYPTVPFLNEHEGYGGQRISHIRGHLDPAAYAYPDGRVPDVILLMMGTNDANRKDGGVPAPTAMASAQESFYRTMRDMFAATPGVHIVVSTLLPNVDEDSDADVANAWVNEFNLWLMTDLGSNVNSHLNGGSWSLIDMYTAAGMNSSQDPGGDFADRLHLSDLGYQKMAMAHFNHLQDLGFPVPEPTTIALLGLGGVLVLRRRRAA